MKNSPVRGSFFACLKVVIGDGRQVSGGDEVLCGVGKEEDGVGDDEDRHGAVQREKGVDVIPKEHDADDKDEAGEHFQETTCGFEDLAILSVFSYRNNDERPRMAQRVAMPRERLLSMARGHHSPSH